MFYIVYKITNLVNDKIYIGAHKTSVLDDGYMGSGNIIKSSIKKYGIENFEKEILEVFETSEEMFEMESKLVTKEFIKKDTNYNLKEGGCGGFDHLIGNYIGSEKHIKQCKSSGKVGIPKAVERSAWLRANDDDWNSYVSMCISNGWKKYLTNGGKSGFDGKLHSEETKKKMSEARKGKVSGEDNPSYGTMWIHSLTEKVSKKIKKDEFSDWEAKGWLKGRKMKFI